MAKQHYVMHERYKDVQTSSKIFEEYINLKVADDDDKTNFYVDDLQLAVNEEQTQQQNFYSPQTQQQNFYSPQPTSYSSIITPITVGRKIETDEVYATTSQDQKTKILPTIGLTNSRYSTPMQLPSHSNTRYSTPIQSSTHSNTRYSTPISPENRGPQLVHANWGTAHPCIQQNNPKRVKWSEEEISYLTQWFNFNLKMRPNMTNPTSKCLAAIKSDPNALPIFHSHHILNSARLRVGYDHYKRIEEEKSLT
jgi:hypothetical protein